MWKAFLDRRAVKLTSVVLALMLTGVASMPVHAQQQNDAKADKHTQKIKKYVRAIRKWGDNEPVTVKLYDGTKIKGHITEADEDHFVVLERKRGELTTIEYAKVRDVTEGLGRKTLLGIVVGGAVLALVGICAATHGCRE